MSETTTALNEESTKPIVNNEAEVAETKANTEIAKEDESNAVTNQINEEAPSEPEQVEKQPEHVVEIANEVKDEHEVKEVKEAKKEEKETKEVSEAKNQGDVKGEHSPDYSEMGLKDIIQAFQAMVDRGDQQELYKYSEIIKAAFYKVLKKEKIASGLFNEKTDLGTPVTENSAVSDDSFSNNPFHELERGFKEVYSKYRESRNVYLQEQEKVKEENLKIKLQIIEDLKSLIEKAEDVNHTMPAFRELQAKWKSITMVPQSKAKELWDTYSHYVEQFYDYIKINNEFKDLDFKKNLEAKTALCEQAEALDKEPNIVNAFKELQRLHEEWKEIGPVSKENREIIWDRFKAITSTINKKHQHFFENLKDEQKTNFDEKTALCEQAEAISLKEVPQSNEWNVLSKEMEALQEKWKTIGFASKKENQKVYDRFRAACDKFYNAKREYYANFKSVMQDNLAKKEDLCAQAEAIMEGDDWKKVTDQLIALQKEWKTIGPVARKQSDAVWKRFRAACDHFFENKAKHFGKNDEEYEANLNAKQELIKKVLEYVVSEQQDDNVTAMRDFQQQFNEIGFVPFKDKEKINSEFNAAMDSHFAEIRNLNSEKRLNKFKKKVSDIKTFGKGDRILKFERDKILQKYKKLESDIATLENNMGFFAKSKKADAYIADIEKKIADAKLELSQMEEQIKLIDKQL